MDTSRWQYLRLANKLELNGYTINERDLDILLLCYENPLTPTEIERNTKWKRKSIYNSINSLAAEGLLQKSNIKAGGGYYYSTAINLDDITAEDFGRLRLTFRGQAIPVQQWAQDLLIGLPAAEFKVRKAFSESVQYLWYKSKNKGNPTKMPGPTSPEVKSFLLNLVKDLKLMTEVYEQLLEKQIFDDSEAVHRLMGDFKDTERATSNFILRWDDGVYRASGLHPQYMIEREEWLELVDKAFPEYEG